MISKGRIQRKVHRIPDLTPAPENAEIQLPPSEIDHNSNLIIKRYDVTNTSTNVLSDFLMDWNSFNASVSELSFFLSLFTSVLLSF